ncbi:MAG: PhnA protein [Epsilonproteobacteria bacterium]|nr:PhnA protein [Campylobacterota bacterium]
MKVCDLCGSEDNVSVYKVGDFEVNLCAKCKEQIQSGNLDENHFQCLNDAMWSENSGVKILSYRLLKKLGRTDLLDMMYLEDYELAIAENEEEVKKDVNGNVLSDGDTVMVIKDLNVKGGDVIKRGTQFKNIRLGDTPGHILAKNIYIKTEFIKKV